MSGAGETRNRGIELVSEDAAESVASNAAVRLYWKKGMVWTVYRSGGKARVGLRGLLARMTEQVRRGRKRVLKALMRPWP